jgi:hypothetical protein
MEKVNACLGAWEWEDGMLGMRDGNEGLHVM